MGALKSVLSGGDGTEEIKDGEERRIYIEITPDMNQSTSKDYLLYRCLPLKAFVY